MVGGEFLAFLENLNLEEIEFLGFLEFLSFWFCWSSRAFGFGADDYLGFLENPKITLSMEAIGSVRVVSRFRWAGVLCSLRWWVCCVGGAQIGGGAVLLWPKSMVVLCCCEAQINGSHTSLYLTLTLFLSLRLIWKFLA